MFPRQFRKKKKFKTFAKKLLSSQFLFRSESISQIDRETKLYCPFMRVKMEKKRSDRPAGSWTSFQHCTLRRTRQFTQSKRWIKYAGDAMYSQCACKE